MFERSYEEHVRSSYNGSLKPQKSRSTRTWSESLLTDRRLALTRMSPWQKQQMCYSMVNGIKGFNRLFPKMANKPENDLDKTKNLALKGTAFTKSKIRPYSETPIPVTMTLNNKLKSLADGQRTNAIASGLPTVRKYFDYSSKDRRNELIVVLPEIDTDSPRMMTSPSESDDEHEVHAINLEKERNWRKQRQYCNWS